MKPVKAIKDPEAFKLLGDETRRKILYLLRAKEMTVAQIAQALNLTPQAVYHHIKKMLDAEMVEVTREERAGHLIESYYRATAEGFYCVVGKTSSSIEVAKTEMKTILDALKKLGFKIEFDDEKTSQLVKLKTELDRLCKSGEFDEGISEQEDIDYISQLYLGELAEMLSMTDEEFKKQQELERKIRELLVSMLKE